MSPLPSMWIRFCVGGADCLIPLEAVAEVARAGRRRLVPRVPIEIGGVLNIRGEPLPVVDGGVLIQGRPACDARYVLILHVGDERVGLMVDRIVGLERRPSPPRSDPLAESTQGPLHWVEERDGRLGILRPDALQQRLRDLLGSGESGRGRAGLGEGPCRSVC